MNNERLLKLILLYKAKELSEDESFELNQWIEESEDNRKEFMRLTDSEGIRHYMQFKTRMSKLMNENAPVRKIGYTYYFRRVAAIAAVLIIAVSGLVIWRNYASEKEIGIANSDQQANNDVAPGKFKARLKLGDGRVIVLDSTNSGLLAQQGQTNIYSEGGNIKYSPENSSQEEVVYNTIETATGETYPVTLSDGTKIWLNSQSLLRFPVVFNGSERRVEMQGEVYFEVQKNRRPFKVAVVKNNAPLEVQVLGTHFNVNAYSDEPIVKTTLLEGRVAVKALSSNKTDYLSPGQQANLDDKGSFKIMSDVNTDAVVAWKDQTFYFESLDLKTIMRQLSRWYGVDVSYEGIIPDRSFSGMINRSRKLSEVLRMLELSNIHFNINGKKLTVKP